MGRLEGKVALITGGASGIGLATARLFAEEGARVVVADLADAEPQPAAGGLASSISFLPLDVTRESDWLATTDGIVRDFGRLDVVVNNAGVSLVKDIEATTLEEFRGVMAVNLDGVFLGCKHAVRVMKERGGGSIVNMSSTAGLVGHGSFTAYCASKGGVRLLTKSVALHCAHKGYNIRCNSVHPGLVETPMFDAIYAAVRDSGKVRDIANAAAPLKRLAQPIEVARAILFLAGSESTFTTGAELVVDGGLTAA